MNGPRRHSVAIPLLLVGLGGCDGDDGAPPEVVVRDSAGITIVGNPAAAPEHWTVSTAPTVDIGVLEGDPAYQLFRAAAAVRLSDGRIVVANVGTHELRFYDPTGRHLLSTGGEGDGPGEFDPINGLWRVDGDSLLVFDRREARVSIFAPHGTFSRSYRLETGEGVSFPLPLGVADGHRILAESGTVFIAGQVETGVARDSSAILRYDPTGALADTLVVLPGTEAYVQASGGSMTVRMLPFGRDLQLAVGGERLFGGTTGHPRIEVRSLDGRLVRLIRWAQPERPSPPRTWRPTRRASGSGWRSRTSPPATGRW